MSGAYRVLASVLALAVLASALGVIWSKHESRTAFIAVQRLQAERDRLDIEWGRLKLEQSTWSSHGRVEQAARSNLKMIIPPVNDVIPVACAGCVAQ